MQEQVNLVFQPFFNFIDFFQPTKAHNVSVNAKTISVKWCKTMQKNVSVNVSHLDTMLQEYAKMIYNYMEHML